MMIACVNVLHDEPHCWLTDLPANDWCSACKAARLHLVASMISGGVLAGLRSGDRREVVAAGAIQGVDSARWRSITLVVASELLGWLDAPEESA